MITINELEKLGEKYNINTQRLINKNENILIYGNYADIDKTLDYLVKINHVNRDSIEKCPSILTLAPTNVITNYNFLKDKPIEKYVINKSLHVLSTDPSILKETYEYISKNYGLNYLNKAFSILRFDVKRIKQVESLLTDKSLIITVVISNLSINDIKRNIDVCKRENVSLSYAIFKLTEDRLITVIKLCKEKNIPIIGNVLLRSEDDILNIYNICKKENIPITGSVFMKTYPELLELIDICRNENISLRACMFNKKNKEIKDIIKVCKNEFISITPSVFKQDANEIKRISLVCKMKNVSIIPSMFMQRASEVSSIIDIARKYNLNITGSLFLRDASKLEASINYVSQNFGKFYIVPLIVNKDVNYLKVVLPYLKDNNLLEYARNSASILTLSQLEIIERTSYIESMGLDKVLPNGKLNSVYGMTRKVYNKTKEKNKVL